MAAGGIEEGGPRRVLVALDPLDGLIAGRHQPLFIALAEAGEIALAEMEIGGSDADELGHPHPRRVEELDHGAIAKAERRRHVRLRDQRVDLLERKELRQRRPGARRLQVVRRTAGQTAVEHQEPVVSANRRDRSSHGPRGQPPGDLLAHEFLERATIERVGLHAEPGRVLRERGQVAPVAFEGVRGQPPLHAQVV